MCANLLQLSLQEGDVGCLVKSDERLCTSLYLPLYTCDISKTTSQRRSLAQTTLNCRQNGACIRTAYRQRVCRSAEKPASEFICKPRQAGVDSNIHNACIPWILGAHQTGVFQNIVLDKRGSCLLAYDCKVARPATCLWDNEQQNRTACSKESASGYCGQRRTQITSIRHRTNSLAGAGSAVL